MNVDLQALLERESEQVEWKARVGDEEDVVATLCAFANDRANLGGGYVVCGAEEGTDAHGAARVEVVGVDASTRKRVEGRVLELCRDRVSPSISPLVEILEGPAGHEVVVFVMAQTGRAHQFRRRNGDVAYYVRAHNRTHQARNGALLELLTLRGSVEPWDRRPCGAATEADLDPVALRDVLTRLGRLDPRSGVEPFVRGERTIHALVPTLCVREPLTGILRPRNFALLLFGREPLRFVPGAFTVLSVYSGKDRSEHRAERHEIEGTLLDQAVRVLQLLDVQAYVAFDKTDPEAPNALRYPTLALREAAVNALVHRSYEEHHPTRITVFGDRVEMESPGGLPIGVDQEEWREGRAGAKWRNQSLAWILQRLQLAQGEGQGMPTIARVMREEGCPPPEFSANEGRVRCVLPAHPRHQRIKLHQAIGEALALGDFERARGQLVPLLESDPLDFRTVLLFAEAQRGLQDPEPIRSFVRRHEGRLSQLPVRALLALADALAASHSDDRDAATLYQSAETRRHELRDAQRTALGLKRFVSPTRALDFLREQWARHPEWVDDPRLLQIEGDAWIEQAKRCAVTARSRTVSFETRQRAWQECLRHLDAADAPLRRAERGTSDASLVDQVRRNLHYAARLREEARRRLR